MAVATQARSLDRRSPMPLWAQLQEELSRRLALGAFDDGFPGEMDLVETYAVSRHTVREALRRLREAGVLDSARGRGTQVRRDIEQPLGSLYSLFREVEARGMTQTSDILALRLDSDEDSAAILGLAAGSGLVFLERIRRTDGEPLAHDRVWLPAELTSALLDADFTRAGLYDELLSRCGLRLTGGQERITACLPTGPERALLGLSTCEACLRVERIGCIGSRVIERRITLVRGDRYSVVADWSPRGYTIGAAAG